MVYERRRDLPRVGIAALAAEAYLPSSGDRRDRLRRRPHARPRVRRRVELGLLAQHGAASLRFRRCRSGRPLHSLGVLFGNLALARRIRRWASAAGGSTSPRSRWRRCRSCRRRRPAGRTAGAPRGELRGAHSPAGNGSAVGDAVIGLAAARGSRSLAVCRRGAPRGLDGGDAEVWWGSRCGSGGGSSHAGVATGAGFGLAAGILYAAGDVGDEGGDRGRLGQSGSCRAVLACNGARIRRAAARLSAWRGARHRRSRDAVDQCAADRRRHRVFHEGMPGGALGGRPRRARSSPVVVGGALLARPEG